jgi:hypothetical protein
MHQYDRLSNNCQTFVDDVLLSLGIETDLKLKGFLKKYIQNLRYKGVCPIEYEIPEIFQEKCGFKEKIIKFNTHKELDVFVATVLKEFPEFPNMELGFDLLKCFDRGFWLKSFRFPEESKYEPDTSLECECHFGNPKDTKRFDWMF